MAWLTRNTFPPMHDPYTRLPDPPTVDEDRIRQYQLRPIPGQQRLFPDNLYVPLPRADNGAWLRAMLNEHGHCSQ